MHEAQAEKPSLSIKWYLKLHSLTFCKLSKRSFSLKVEIQAITAEMWVSCLVGWSTRTHREVDVNQRVLAMVIDISVLNHTLQNLFLFR